MAGKAGSGIRVQKADKYDYLRIVLTKQLNMGKRDAGSLSC